MEIPHIDVEELAKRLGQDGTVLLDVRQPDEWDEAHIAEAALIPLGELSDRWSELPEGEILVICRSGGRSATAVEALLGAGRTAVNVAGGMLAWIESGHPYSTATSPNNQ